MENQDREFGWDDQIENDGADFVLLPEGDYEFEVTAFERCRHNGSEKLPPCNKATLTIKIAGANGQETSIKHNLFLHSKCEGMLCAFFTSIGQRKHGEKVTMNWNAVTGSRGRCKLGIKTYEGKQYNEIKKLYEPVEGQQTTPQWKAGNF